MSETLVHESAYVDSGAEIGNGTRVWHFSHVMSGAVVGRECVLGQNVFVASGACLGDRVKLQNNVSVFDGVTLENDVFCGPSAVFTNVKTPRAHVSRRDAFVTTHVGRGATIGANATVICGVTIGAHAFVGAGAVVTHDVPPYALVIGTPATQDGWVCHCGPRLTWDGPRGTCPECSAAFVLEDAMLRPTLPRDATPEHAPIPLVDVRAENALHADAIQKGVADVLTTGHFILGPSVARFEEDIATVLGVSHAIGVSSGTDALVIALRALGVGPGDEVITTPFSFISTAEAIVRVGATLVFADIDPLTLNLCPQAVADAITPRTRALLPVHLYGQPADMDALQAIADAHGLLILEDAAQAIGAFIGERAVGSLGDIAAFSFFPTKNLGAAGDGGLITTNNDDLAHAARRLRQHGTWNKGPAELLGYNARLDAIQAAVLNAKLPSLLDDNRARRALAQRYDRAFAELSAIVPLSAASSEITHAYHQYTVRVTDGRRDHLQRALADARIASRAYYDTPLHHHPAFRTETSFPVAEAASTQVISLPFWPHMEHATQDRVIDAVRRALRP